MTITSIPVYDPVHADVVSWTIDRNDLNEYGIFIFRLRNGEVHYKFHNIEFSAPILINTALFDETQGHVLPFFYQSADNEYILQIDGFDYLWKKISPPFEGQDRYHLRYAAVDREPGKFIFLEDLCPIQSCDITELYGFQRDHLENLNGFWHSNWSASYMVWDEKRNVVMKYGIGETSDTGWTSKVDASMREWDGKTWTLRLDIPNPLPPKENIRMVYDEARGVTILFDPDKGETWEYNGFCWKNKTPSAGQVYREDRYPLGPYIYRIPEIIYDTCLNRTVLFISAYDEDYALPQRKEIWFYKDDATTQTYSRRNVMEEGCEMRQWGEAGVDCSFTSSTSWSRIIVVKTEDGTAPMIGDLPTSGIWSADVLWEIKTDRPPDPEAAESTGTLISISYTPEMTDRITTDASSLKLYVARPDIPVGVPISDTLQNNMRTFDKWHSPPTLDHEPLPGEYGVYHDIQDRRFLLRITMEEPFYGSPSGLPREDGEPASLCYAIGTETPDILRMLKNAILDKHTYTKEEKSLMDQNADAAVNAADVVKILNF